MVRRRSRLRGWFPLVVLGVVVVAIVVGVVVAVSALRPTVGRADDLAIYSPPMGGRQPDVVSGQLRREAGCTYLDGEDGRRWLVVFPDLGSRWEDDSLRVANNRYPLDASVDLRGRIVKLPVSGYATDIPVGCTDVGLVLFVRL